MYLTVVCYSWVVIMRFSHFFGIPLKNILSELRSLVTLLGYLHAEIHIQAARVQGRSWRILLALSLWFWYFISSFMCFWQSLVISSNSLSPAGTPLVPQTLVRVSHTLDTAHCSSETRQECSSSIKVEMTLKREDVFSTNNLVCLCYTCSQTVEWSPDCSSCVHTKVIPCVSDYTKK